MKEEINCTPEQLARMELTEFWEYLQKKFDITWCTGFGEIIDVAKSRVECIRPDLGSPSYGFDSEKLAESRKMVEDYFVEYFVRYGSKGEMLEQTIYPSLEEIYSCPWGRDDDAIRSYAGEFAKEYGLKEGTGRFKKYQEVFLENYKEYPVAADMYHYPFKEHHARHVAICRAEHKRIIPRNANGEGKGIGKTIWNIVGSILIIIGLVTLFSSLSFMTLILILLALLCFSGKSK